MANRSRSTAKSGVVQKPGDKPAAAATVVEADDSKPISLSSADFDNNPAVVNMADIVDGPAASDADLDVNRIPNEANEANARRIVEADRAKPAGSPFSNADTESDDEDDDEDDPLAGAPINQPGPAVEPAPAPEAPAPAKGEARKGSVMVTLGDRTKAGGRAPYAVTVIVPRAGSDTDEAHDGLITDGTTVQLARGRATRVSARAADWLASHRLFDISEVKVQR